MVLNVCSVALWEPPAPVELWESAIRPGGTELTISTDGMRLSGIRGQQCKRSELSLGCRTNDRNEKCPGIVPL